ncbi:hypothetical protein BRADI_4g00224v3 [Brachypodium distachyon]|uniref:Uncharacterized protein n=1 Tax=Brachypodium distachyon TaxID=15368 RepID=A0A2K2CJP7_BRADI|nr:hypothetical protein BRADI_4g00224v3 [Brachypodium distachyon]
MHTKPARRSSGVTQGMMSRRRARRREWRDTNCGARLQCCVQDMLQVICIGI